ncbi:MAG TPA: beta-propeller domain-containing protein, partial [Polyangiaceae bacterium]
MKLAGVMAWTLALALGGCGGPDSSRGGDGSGNDASVPVPAADYQSAPPPRPVEGGDDESYDPLSFDETGITALDGNRLYYLSGDRGLIVIDVTNVDAPRVLGGSPLSGNPQAVYVEGNLVIVVFGGWFATTSQGQPFQGSVVRVLDATDPTNVALVGEVPIDGYVQESRVVGDILYAAGTDRGASYGMATASPSARAVITSVGWSTGSPQKLAEQTIPGDDATFAFAPKALLASTVTASGATVTTTLQYVDLGDPAGGITLRGTLPVTGTVGSFSGYCSNTGSWSLDFADGVHAHAVAIGGGNGNGSLGAALATGDFTNPDAPVLSSMLPGLEAPGDEQGIVPRFDVEPGTGRALLYIGHSATQGSGSTALDIFDLSNAASPQQAGTLLFPGDICSMQPNGTRLLATSSFENMASSAGMAIEQFDVADPTTPTTAGSTQVQAVRDVFPATDAPWETTIDPTGSLALLPVIFNPPSGPYTYGLEVLSLGSANLAPIGTATSKDVVLRGIFVRGRAYAFSEEALTVFDITNPAAPQSTAHHTFAPYVYAVEPIDSVVAELTFDIDGDTTTDVRLVAPSA